jgi:hypothetical protein
VNTELISLFVNTVKGCGGENLLELDMIPTKANEALSFSIEYADANNSLPPPNSDRIDKSIITSFRYRF